MAEASYAVVFQGGILTGFERGEVMQRFGELFGLAVEDVEKVFGHRRVVLKRNLDRAAADAYRTRLAGIGMDVSLDDGHAPAAAPTGAQASAPAAAKAQAPETRLPIAAAASHDPSPAVAPAPSSDSGQGASDAPSSQAERPSSASQGFGTAAPTWAHAPDAPERRDLPFEFSGNGGEFFRIWIVNIFLTIVTLGLYSAWAKVRTQRYFYGNTQIDGTSFEYLADPMKIFKGRLVAFALLVVYMLADQFLPPLAAVLMLVFFVAFPWVMVRALAFRNHNSAWRGVRFGFDGRVGEAYKVFLLWPLLGAISFGLLFPYAIFRQQQFIIGNSRYGTESFAFSAGARDFYMIALAALGVMLAGGVAMAVLSATLPFLAPLAIVAAYLTVFALSNVMMANLRFNHTTLGAHALRANYELKSYAILMVTNTLAIGLTLGLFYPWAKVRNARYAAAHTGVDAEGNLDEFAAGQRKEVSALGGEIGDVFDVDVGI